jgi:hypothetical protein
MAESSKAEEIAAMRGRYKSACEMVHRGMADSAPAVLALRDMSRLLDEAEHPQREAALWSSHCDHMLDQINLETKCRALLRVQKDAQAGSDYVRAETFHRAKSLLTLGQGE